MPALSLESSNIATALLSASAIKSRRPSGESAKAFGVLPSPVPPGTVSNSWVITCALVRSTTATRSVLAEATKSRVPVELSRRDDGWRPT